MAPWTDLVAAQKTNEQLMLEALVEIQVTLRQMLLVLSDKQAEQRHGKPPKR